MVLKTDMSNQLYENSIRYTIYTEHLNIKTIFKMSMLAIIRMGKCGLRKFSNSNMQIATIVYHTQSVDERRIEQKSHFQLS